MSLTALTRATNTVADFEPCLYKLRSSFDYGFIVRDASTALLWAADEGGDDNYYVWEGALPKTVNPGSTPASTGGVGAGAWRNVGTGFILPTLAANAYKWDNFVFLEDYYQAQDGDDWGPAFNRAFSAHTDVTSFNVQLRSRDYAVRTPVVYNGDAAVSITGRNGTKLHLDINDTGTMYFFYIKSVRRMCLQNFQVDVIGKAGSKVAFYLDCTGQDRSHTLINIVTTATVQAGQGVIMFDLVNPGLWSVQDCHVRFFGAGRVLTSNNMGFRLSAYGGKVCTDGRFENCSVIEPEIAFLVDLPDFGSNTSLEGVLFCNCTVVGAIDGCRIVGDPNNYRPPMMRWIGGHIMAYSSCFLVSHASQIHVDHAFFYLEYNAAYSGTGGRSAVNLLDAEEVYINNLSIHMFYVPDGTGSGITVGDKSTVIHLDTITVFADRGVYSVTGVPGSKNVRAFNCCTVATSIDPKPSSLNLLGTNTADLGGNHILP